MVATDAMADRRRDIWGSLVQYSRHLQSSIHGLRERGGANRLHGKHAWHTVDKAQFFEEYKALPHAEEIGARPSRHKDGGRGLPVELLTDLKGRRLIAIGLIGLQRM